MMLKLAFKISKGENIDLDKEIELHTKKYQWIPYNYGSYIFTKAYFLKELQSLLKKNNLKEQISEIQRSYKNLKKRQQQIIRDLNIDQYHQALFEAIRLNSFIIDYKKKVFTISHFYINYSLVKEISRRLKIKQKLAQCLLREEVADLLLGRKKIDRLNLKKRFESFVIFCSKDKFKFESGSETLKFLSDLGVYEDAVLRLKEFKGQTASLGQVEGRVKVITGPKDFYKMRQGDIIVSHMTTPEFVPVLKQAAGIITDEGGITCHAAIVSRELKIPCVIGTKVATKILHDNNIVDLIANQGLIKVLYTSSPNL